MNSHEWIDMELNSESQIFNSQIKFIVKRHENQYLGFGCSKFTVFEKIPNKNKEEGSGGDSASAKNENAYSVTATSGFVDFANIILIESDYIYII
jgi:hypothetical protein